MKRKDMPLPYKMMSDLLRKHSELPRLMDEVRDRDSWSCPSYCYIQSIPTKEYLFNTIHVDTDKNLPEPVRIAQTYTLLESVVPLLIWQQSKSIYRFDATLAHTLVNQPLDDIVSYDALYRLPEWCTYIDLENTDIHNNGLTSKGVFVYLDSHPEKGTRMILSYFQNDGNIIFAFPVWFTKGSLSEAIQSQLQDNIDVEKKAVIPELYSASNEMHQQIMSDRTWLARTLQLVIYLCSSTVDLPDEYHPIVRRYGHSSGPSLPRVWDIGVRVGAELRSTYSEHNKASAVEENSSTTDNKHSSPRPHLRRAHWHHFRTGPEHKGELVVRWIQPTLINAKDPDQLIPTLRDVV